MSNIHKNFNSRTRVGATKKQLGGRIGLLVSIHAPVWVRPEAAPVAAPAKKFQFTHPCGCDNNALKIAVEHSGFNSRTRVGATFDPVDLIMFLEVSIHAPVWVRHFPVILIPQAFRFQFTHPCGCDILPTGEIATLIVSIHAPVWVRRPDEYGLSIKHATKVLRQPDARTRCGQA